MKANKLLYTDLMKEIDMRCKNATSKCQEIWLRASEMYLDDLECRCLSEEDVEFFIVAFYVIRSRGENVNDYTKDELYQVHTMLSSAILLNREDLITHSHISLDFPIKVKEKLENLGVGFI